MGESFGNKERIDFVYVNNPVHVCTTGRFMKLRYKPNSPDITSTACHQPTRGASHEAKRSVEGLKWDPVLPGDRQKR